MARSIKFSDDTYLDASSVNINEYPLSTLLGNNLGRFIADDYKSFVTQVANKLISDEYPFFLGTVEWMDHDAYFVISPCNISYLSPTFIIMNDGQLSLVRKIGSNITIKIL